ncbi:MAG: 50S ribosomal protein L15 [Oscillospiraceae bacterium]|nr:50S ribosomal protein L15 [Oscillospiraceae bacterium]
MEIHELSPAPGSRKKAWRKGRGYATGNGKTAGRGHKGQKARSGGVRVGFEGGQMPLARRIPKRGFNNIFAKPLESVNVGVLNDRFEDGAEIDAQVLLDAGVLSKCQYGVKILGSGDITKKLTVRAKAFSATAKEKIEAAGGKAEVV